MPTVRTKTTYLALGAEYRTLEKVKEAIENRLGRIIDAVEGKHGNNIGPTVSLNMLKAIVDNKKLIVELLTTEIDKDGVDIYVNVLDL